MIVVLSKTLIRRHLVSRHTAIRSGGSLAIPKRSNAEQDKAVPSLSQIVNRRARNSCLLVALANIIHCACVRQLVDESNASEYWSFGVPICAAFTAVLVVCAQKVASGKWHSGTLLLATMFACISSALFSWGIGSTLYYGYGLPWTLCIVQIALAASWWYAVVAISIAWGANISNK